MDYLEFLKQKQKKHVESGFELPDDALNKSLFPFQRFYS